MVLNAVVVQCRPSTSRVSARLSPTIRYYRRPRSHAAAHAALVAVAVVFVAKAAVAVEVSVEWKWKWPVCCSTWGRASSTRVHHATAALWAGVGRVCACVAEFTVLPLKSSYKKPENS